MFFKHLTMHFLHFFVGSIFTYLVIYTAKILSSLVISLFLICLKVSSKIPFIYIIIAIGLQSYYIFLKKYPPPRITFQKAYKL